MRSPRLLLLDPPFYRLYKDTYGLGKYPLGLASLAAAVRAARLGGLPPAEVRVINADFHPSPEPFSASYLTGQGYAAYRRALLDPAHPVYADLGRRLAAYQPDVVGISVKTPVLASALICARLVKAIVPQALVVAGGPHPSVTGAAMLAHEEIDLVVPGEGEPTLVELMQAMAAGQDLETVQGIIFRRNSAVRRTPARPPLIDLDLLPPANEYASQVLEDYGQYPASAFGYVFSARGCPHGCSFCSSRGVWGRQVRYRSVANVLAELAGLRNLGLTHVHFDDDTFGVTEKRLITLCRALEEARLGLTFGCQTHVRLVSAAGAAALSRAGFTTVQLGLESGDNHLLARLGKGITVEEASTAARRIKDAGLSLEVFFMVGFPEETEASLRATRRLMESLNCDKIIYSIFTPYPGTPLYDQCLRAGLIGPDYDYSRHNHQSPENCFCPHISPARFRALAGEIEALVTAKNAAARKKSGVWRPESGVWSPESGVWR